MESTSAEERQAFEKQIQELQEQVAQAQARDSVIFRLLKSLASKGKMGDIVRRSERKDWWRSLGELSKGITLWEDLFGQRMSEDSINAHLNVTISSSSPCR